MGDELRELVAVLLGVDQGARVHASFKLIALREEARAPVVKVLTDTENSYLARVWAAIILSHTPDDPEGSVCEALRAALQSPLPGLRWVALGALGSQRAVAAIPDIAAHLDDHAEIPEAWSEEDSQPAFAAEAALRAIGTPEALAILARRAGSGPRASRPHMKSAVIIGASSGIGRALAVALSLDGYRVGVVARRTDLLDQLRAELKGPCVIKTVDVSQPELAMPLVRELIDELRDVELFIVNAGTGFQNAALAWEPERETIAVNVLGFAGMVNVAVAHLETRGSGHLVGISSLAALRGIAGAPAYAASKAFVSNYLQGVRYRFNKLKLPIVVTDVQPGFVDTPMAGGNRFWIASPEKAAQQIVAAIRRRKHHVYVTKRWRLIAWLMQIVPDAWYSKV